jgi:hypothetical protein
MVARIELSRATGQGDKLPLTRVASGSVAPIAEMIAQSDVFLPVVIQKASPDS